jgi:hypothetical protein
MQPDPTGELFAALSNAQGEIEGARKDSENPTFESRYADLQSVWAACREPLSKNNLSIWQHVIHGADGRAYLQTTIGHSSGQTLSDHGIPLLLGRQDMQGLGSAITYARRYGLMAAVGIAPEDDDGNLAVGSGMGIASDAKAVQVQSGQARARAQASMAPTVEAAVPEQPGPIPLPDCAEKNLAWLAWCKALKGACLAAPTLAADWVSLNQQGLIELKSFNSKWHDRLVRETTPPLQDAA